MPFWSIYNDYGDESGTLYIPAGSFMPTADRAHHDEGPRWADNEFSGTNAGLLTNVSFGKNWVARLGAFRSSVFNRRAYTHLLANEQRDGTAERILIADPPNHSHPLSGELRVTHSIAEGPRLHLIRLERSGARCPTGIRRLGIGQFRDWQRGRTGDCCQTGF